MVVNRLAVWVGKGLAWHYKNTMRFVGPFPQGVVKAPCVRRRPDGWPSPRTGWHPPPAALTDTSTALRNQHKRPFPGHGNRASFTSIRIRSTWTGVFPMHGIGRMERFQRSDAGHNGQHACLLTGFPAGQLTCLLSGCPASLLSCWLADMLSVRLAAPNACQQASTWCNV